MKILFSLILSVILFFSSAISQEKSDTAKSSSIEKFDPKRDAGKDLKNAIKLAKKENKNILLDVGGEWCPWCKKLNKVFTSNSEIAEILKNKFIVLKINYSKENKNEKVLSKYPQIKGYPHLFVLDKTGKLLHSQDTGELESGDHHDPEKVLKFLKEWSK